MLDRDKRTSTSNPAGTEVKTDAKSTKKLSRRTLLKGAAAVAGAAAGSDAITRLPDHLGAGDQGHRAAPCRRVLFGGEGDRRPGGQGSRLQGDDAEPRHLGRDQPLHHPAEHGRYRRSRGLAGQARRQARRDPGHRGQEDQGVRQHPADLHQGRDRRPQDSAPGHLALRGDVYRKAGFDRSARRRHRMGDLPAAGLQRRLDRLPPRSGRPRGDRVEGPDRSQVQGQGRDPRRARHRHHGCRAVLRKRRPDQVRQQGQHDQGGDRLHLRQADRAEEERASSARPGPPSTSRCS